MCNLRKRVKSWGLIAVFALGTNTRFKMLKTIDLYLGAFLILCGFGISLLNLRNIVKSRNKFSPILLSENILLMCIGIAFLCRAIYSLNPVNVSMEDIEIRTGALKSSEASAECGFHSLLLGYGPLVVSLVNSFLGLVIDNYLHYRMLTDMKKVDEGTTVQEIGEASRALKEIKLNKVYEFFKKYFPYITIAVQWIVPILIALFMYPINVKEMPMNEVRSLDDSCMATLDLIADSCFNKSPESENITTELRKYKLPPMNYLEVIDKEQQNTNISTQIDSVLSNVLDIVKKFNNHTDFEFTNLTKSLRQPKFDDRCIKMCFTDNKNMLLYMFMLAFISYFVPITISTIILTKIHIVEVNRPNAKTYVTRELLYNILFWTPVMFDTFLSLVMCSFAMHGLRTSFLNVIANIYQAVKNFMNTRYFKENAVVPM